MNVSKEGLLGFGSTVFAENPTTLLEKGDFHGYEFAGKAGGVITITATGSTCGAPDTVIDLFGPENASGDRGRHLVENDDAYLACGTDSQIASYTLPVDGEYLIVVTSFLQAGGGANGHYKLTLTCNNAACNPVDAPTFASTRINQADIDRGVFTPDQLFEIGDILFDFVFQTSQGLGNALTAAPGGTAARPNFRKFPNNVHFAAFGAPEAQSCVTCHNQGGFEDNSGDVNHNIFQIGDGVNRTSGVPRNPPMVIGTGLRQQIGIEMTAALQTQLASAKSSAASTGVAVTKALSAKGVSFGSIVANPDGTVNFTGLRGVDTDLVVKPFGWKGREATIRRFIEGGFRVHFGMQTQPSIVKHCATPNANTFGTGADCQDPDADGVKVEISEGQLTAESIYMALRETPVRVPALTATAQSRVNAGETLFSSLGCAGCHVPRMTLTKPIHVEAPDTTGGAGITINFAIDQRDPHPALNADGSMTVEAFSDYKRHDMGTALADSKNFNQIAANQFITPALWGVGVTAPYLHDGRAATLHDAILAHAGEALTARNAYAARTADDQLKVQEFLSSLGRDDQVAAAKVNLGGYIVKQAGAAITFTIPANTLVPHGGVLVIGRNATKASFETYWGKTLGTNAVYLNSAAIVGIYGTPFPQIDGSETFQLVTRDNVLLDGPSVAIASTGHQNLQRRNGAFAAGTEASWVRSADTTLSIATPGAASPSTGAQRIYVTEIADAPSSTAFEFIEIFVE